MAGRPTYGLGDLRRDQEVVRFLRQVWADNGYSDQPVSHEEHQMPPPMEVLLRDGAIERLLRQSATELEHDSSSDLRLVHLYDWLVHLATYLDASMESDRRDLYRVPFILLFNAIEDLWYGRESSLLKKRIIAKNPGDRTAILTLKVRCILASDEIFFHQSQPVTRAEADRLVFEKVRSSVLAQQVNMNAGTLKQWRRALRGKEHNSRLQRAHAVLSKQLVGVRRDRGPEAVVDYLLLSPLWLDRKRAIPPFRPA